MACGRCFWPTPPASCWTSSTSIAGAPRSATTPQPIVPCAAPYQAHARATLGLGHVCAVLSPSREIKVFADGAEIFAFRGGAWHLLDIAAKYDVWADGRRQSPACRPAVPDGARPGRRARGRAVRPAPGSVVRRAAGGARRTGSIFPSRPTRRSTDGPSRRDLLHLLEGRTATDLDPTVFAALASLDGAIVVDPSGRLLAAGAILRHPQSVDMEFGGVIEGARTTAAMAASRLGPVLKVSEDGIITFFDQERVWDI